ncbi:hypothetical protein C8R43DRAFT_1132716 [Mycena crocata]|nr:hypothetical protein C8R43DRAFT_1132716 [Mycena crocata]
MSLVSVAEYTELLKQVQARPKVEAKLEIMELVTTAHAAANTADGDGNDETDKSKKRKRTLTAEEEEMAETIVQIQAATCCSDRSCHSRYCFVANPTAKHVRLTPIHLNSSASQGSDNERHLIIPFLAASVPGTASLPPSTPRRSALVASYASPAKPAQMSFLEFCHAFKLSADISERLAPLELDGPHVLPFIENTILDQYLKFGQRASLRFAEDQWSKGKVHL